MRKKILDTINIDAEMFCTSFDNAAKLLLEKKAELEKEGWSGIHLKMEYYSGDGSELLVKGMRLETDVEMNNRLKKERSVVLAQERKIQSELKRLKELKEKYENQ